ncbi:hypothetical protein [Pantoea piersonii]|uniref:hypothetical protein n=1 Tax=Pantoea piersonii TaxID=2364647 RepID=UPI0028AA08E6|nr:hypothetical protein [Pantoea piersonii]
MDIPSGISFSGFRFAGLPRGFFSGLRFAALLRLAVDAYEIKPPFFDRKAV